MTTWLLKQTKNINTYQWDSRKCYTWNAKTTILQQIQEPQTDSHNMPINSCRTTTSTNQRLQVSFVVLQVNLDKITFCKAQYNTGKCWNSITMSTWWLTFHRYVHSWSSCEQSICSWKPKPITKHLWKDNQCS